MVTLYQIYGAFKALLLENHRPKRCDLLVCLASLFLFSLLNYSGREVDKVYVFEMDVEGCTMYNAQFIVKGITNHWRTACGWRSWKAMDPPICFDPHPQVPFRDSEKLLESKRNYKYFAGFCASKWTVASPLPPHNLATIFEKEYPWRSISSLPWPFAAFFSPTTSFHMAGVRMQMGIISVHYI